EAIRATLSAHDVVDALLVPATVIFEVRRWCYRIGLSDEEIRIIGASLGTLDVVPMDGRIAARAANVAVTTGLAFADASILATTRAHFATLFTYDRDFAGLAGVVVLDKP